MGGRSAEYHPDVVGLLAGRWDITDHLVDGRVVSIDQPAWNRHLEEEMDQVVAVLSARGAQVVLFTMPYIDPPEEEPDGAALPRERAVAGRRVQRASWSGWRPATPAR